MYVKNCWYVAAWNYEVAENSLYKCMVMNTPIVIYSKESGGYVALEDRCCHRAFPLSMGRREGDDLRCMYHGFKFSPAGQCIEIPGQERIPSNACVRTFPVVEAHSWIWVWMGDPAKADLALIPHCKGLDTPGLASRSGHMEYDTYYELINDNLLDFSHLGYVHADSFGTSEDYAYVRPTVRRIERGVRIERWLRNQAPAFIEYPGLIDKWLSYDYVLPGILMMTAHYVAAGGADLNGSGPPDLAKTPSLFYMHTDQAVTPVSDTRSRYSYSTMMTEMDGAAGMLDILWNATIKAFIEDRIVIEAQAKILALDPTRKLVPSIFDAAAGQFHWLIEKMAKDESEAWSARLAESAA